MKGLKRSIALGTAALIAGISSAHAADINVAFTNNAPTGGTYLTPAWVGFHNGSFDLFTAGPAGSALPALESIAEDGNTGPLFTAFDAFGSGDDAMVGGGPVAPGQTVDTTLSVAEDGSGNYFSFASMVLPSSDFFIGNDNPLSLSIAGLLDGTFKSISVNVVNVYDAGTEVNDFATSAGNPLFPIAGLPAGQGGPNQGADEGAFVTLITSAAYGDYGNSAGLDLSALGFSDYDSIATFTLTAVPVPAALPLLLTALGGLGFMRKRA